MCFGENGINICSFCSAGKPGESTKKSKLSFALSLFKVELNYCCEFPLRPIALISEGNNICEGRDALRILNTILRQRAVNKYSLSPIVSLCVCVFPPVFRLSLSASVWTFYD